MNATEGVRHEPTALPQREELKARARELLAAELDKHIRPGVASDREQVFDKLGLACALSAIEAALSQPSPPLPVGLREALERLVNARALSGVREQVAGWNGEGRPDGYRFGRHPDRLGATLPKTTCGAVYELDEAMEAARAALSATAQDAWQDIAGAPKGTAVLVVVSPTEDHSYYPVTRQDVHQAVYELGEGWLDQSCSPLENSKWRVTHWMPLPTPPSTQGEG